MDGLTSANVEFVRWFLPVKPSAKRPPVGASCWTLPEKSVVLTVLTSAPVSVEEAGVSEWERVMAACRSGSKMPCVWKSENRVASAELTETFKS